MLIYRKQFSQEPAIEGSLGFMIVTASSLQNKDASECSLHDASE